MVDVSLSQRHILLLLENASYELGTGDGNGMLRRETRKEVRVESQRGNEERGTDR